MSLYEKRKLEEFKNAQEIVENDADFLDVYATKLKEHEIEDKMNLIRRVRDKKLKKKRLRKNKKEASDDENEAQEPMGIEYSDSGSD